MTEPRPIPAEEQQRLADMRALRKLQQETPKEGRMRLPVTLAPGEPVRKEIIPAGHTDAQLLALLAKVYGNGVARAGRREQEK